MAEEKKVVILVAQVPVSVRAVEKAGGEVPWELLRHHGGARIERGQLVEVYEDVAEKLCASVFISEQPGFEGKAMPRFRRQHGGI